LKYLARFLLLFENIRPVGSFLDNKRVVLVAAPHQSGKDEYLMILIILALDVDVCYLSAKWTMRRIPNPFEKSKDIDDQGIKWPLGWLQEIIFRKFGAIPVDRKGNSGQYDSVIEELKKRDSFLLIVTPEGRFDATRFRTSFLFIAKELNAEVMPVQIDYENERFNILESFNIEGDTESVVKNLRLKFDGIKGKKSRFKA
jgi:1-acyl-sn-glycerol-3-phosphate acyltransferase